MYKKSAPKVNFDLICAKSGFFSLPFWLFRTDFYQSFKT
jgi:hypothetical protein